jgi:hypothetical protein
MDPISLTGDHDTFAMAEGKQRAKHQLVVELRSSSHPLRFSNRERVSGVRQSAHR